MCDFRGIFSCGTQQVVPSGQESLILHARIANHSAGLYCPLTELIIIFLVLVRTITYLEFLQQTRLFQGIEVFKLDWCTIYTDAQSTISSSLRNIIRTPFVILSWQWINQHDTTVEQRKNLSPRRESNPWPPEHQAGTLSTELKEPMESKVIILILFWAIFLAAELKTDRFFF